MIPSKLMFRPMFLLALPVWLAAQPTGPGINYDEAKVKPYTLPDPLVYQDGTRVKSRAGWARRRAEILQAFETQVYGKGYPKLKSTVFEPTDVDTRALGGKAVRKQVLALFSGKKDGPRMEILLYLPAGVSKPVPVFVGLNFMGNHAVHADPAIHVPDAWVRNNAQLGITNNRTTEKQRAAEASRWAIEKILARGYGVATVYYGDIDPDYDDGFANGIHPLFYKPGQTRPAPDEGATITAWAWGISRIADYLQTDKAVDASRLALMGHSRLGKAALWAGALDDRFSLVISNNSGEGGASLARRWFGETTERINTSFPHWFAGNFKQYNTAVDKLPVDQHMLMALIAPRSVYVNSAQEDTWADPRGEFLGLRYADPVFQLLGKPGLGVEEMPGIHQPVGRSNGYHIRAGKHDVTDYDWEQWMNFAERLWGRR